MIVGIAAETQHNVGHGHGGETPGDIQMGTIVEQATFAAHNEIDFRLEEYGKDADNETRGHIGYTLWSKLAIGEDTQREDLVVQLKQIRQIGLRGDAEGEMV